MELAHPESTPPPTAAIQLACLQLHIIHDCDGWRSRISRRRCYLVGSSVYRKLIAFLDGFNRRYFGVILLVRWFGLGHPEIAPLPVTSALERPRQKRFRPRLAAMGRQARNTPITSRQRARAWTKQEVSTPSISMVHCLLQTLK